MNGKGPQNFQCYVPLLNRISMDLFPFMLILRGLQETVWCIIKRGLEQGCPQSTYKIHCLALSTHEKALSTLRFRDTPAGNLYMSHHTANGTGVFFE